MKEIIVSLAVPLVVGCLGLTLGAPVWVAYFVSMGVWLYPPNPR